MVDDPHVTEPGLEPGAIPELVLPVGVEGPKDQPTRFDPDHEESSPPSAWFVLYYNGTNKEGRWAMVEEILVAHDTTELLDRVFDRYPGIKQAAKVTFIPADQGEVYGRDWKRLT